MSPDPIFTARVEHLDGSAVVALAGELDIAAVPVLLQAVADVVSPHLRALVIDMADVTFVDVRGLRGLLGARQTATSAGAEFRLRYPTELIRWVIRLVDLPGLHDSIEADAVT